MNQPTFTYYELLENLVNNPETTLFSKYKTLRRLLERICKDEMNNTDLQSTDLSARISFVSDKLELSYGEQQRLHSLRLTANAIMNLEKEPEADSFLRDVKSLSFFIQKVTGESIPDDLYRLLPLHDATYLAKPIGKEAHKQLRVCFLEEDENYLYVLPLDSLSNEPLKVKFNEPDYNEEFKDIRKYLWPHAQLNLLHVIADENEVLIPQFIVLEPDYLLDVSALAECYRPYGAHPANYILSKLQTIDNPRPLLLGNIANHFLDEWIYADEPVNYVASMKKVFKKYAIELASCPDLNDPKIERQFFEDCKLHFDHINIVVNQTFNTEGYKLDRSEAVLEPSYICESLGIQGRLDYMQQDMSSFIEMKSGKADEFFIRGKKLPHQNHRIQMLLYQAMLEQNMEQNHRDVRAYLLYTKYPLLYPAKSSWKMVQEAIQLRNKIVSTEFSIQSENSLDYTETILKQITPDTVNTKGIQGKLWTNYLEPSIAALQKHLQDLTDIERAYFYATYNFITKELYTSKSGDMNYETKRGASCLWNSSFTDKCEEGTLLLDLSIIENRAADLHKAGIVFKRDLDSEKKYNMSLPNFRAGDAIVFYERNGHNDNVTNKLVFKGNIEYIQKDQIAVRLRAAQRNLDVVSESALYAIEPDSMDISFRNMFLGLDAFVKTNSTRRNLLLGINKPKFDKSLYEKAEQQSDDLERIVGKAIAAKDYLLLVGPPGTGKTSFALRRMVEEFSARGKDILLLAYTNQAVDEICKSISKIEPKLNYIRLGSELSCNPMFRPQLLEEILSEANNRQAVKNIIQGCNVYVSTVASLSGKMDLFRLKSFDVTIIDEASQILEPQLLGILTAKDSKGKDAIDKFILIGDHKQLPAVVQQKEETSKIISEELNDLHIYNMRDALFQRLYRLDYPQAKEILLRQGRMHPDLAQFVNKYFYGNKLKSLNLEHQCEIDLPLDELYIYADDTHKTKVNHRILFVPSDVNLKDENNKVNEVEAIIVANIAKQIVDKYKEEFDANKSLGIITPYRSQIALIKSKLEEYKMEELNDVLVDTVERFQGSERDVIIYSFCVNESYQLDFLCNLIQEDNLEIDRKLNVALTRARKQLFITGVPEILRLNSVYRSLLDYIESQGIDDKLDA